MIPSPSKVRPFLSYPLKWYPIAFLDYLWVISIYVVCSFTMGILIDGHLTLPFDYVKESKESSWFLGMKIMIQLFLQGFLAIFITAFLQTIPTPVHGWLGYDPHSSMGALLRNPAIISVLLFALSVTVQLRIKYLYSRFDKNAPFVPPSPKKT